MHLNYYFLRQLSPVLATKLEGLDLVSCFSQNKDELVFGFATTTNYFVIKALLSSDICCLSFPDEYRRSKNNSVDLFQGCIGWRVQRVRQFLNERAFAIYLYPTNQPENSPIKSPKLLLFKLHGQRSNVILLENSNELEQENQSENFQAAHLAVSQYVATEMFRNHLEKDWQITLDGLDRNIDQSQEGFDKNGLQKTFPTFEKSFIQFIEKKDTHLVFNDLIPLLNYLTQPKFYVVVEGEEVKFSLFEPQNLRPAQSVLEFDEPLAALNKFFNLFSRRYFFEGEKNKIIRKIENRIKQTENYIAKTEEKLLEVEYKTPYEQLANILMANLHALPTQVLHVAKTVELYDFYNNEPIQIKLRENLTPQKTAEVFYRKSKNQKIEIDKLYKNIKEKQELLTAFQKNLTDLQAITDSKTLRKYLRENDLGDEDETDVQVLFRKFMYQGFEILVGKSAKNNDLLTQRYAYKEDLWLHAKDVSGSHVVVKYQSGKKFPSMVIEKAAQLAAFYSKRKTDTLCPVTYTPKKFVRKPKGVAEGMVKVEREQVLLVKPDEAFWELGEE